LILVVSPPTRKLPFHQPLLPINQAAADLTGGILGRLCCFRQALDFLGKVTGFGAFCPDPAEGMYTIEKSTTYQPSLLPFARNNHPPARAARLQRITGQSERMKSVVLRSPCSICQECARSAPTPYPLLLMNSLLFRFLSPAYRMDSFTYSNSEPLFGLRKTAPGAAFSSENPSFSA
jgi:hypothetical protein